MLTHLLLLGCKCFYFLIYLRRHSNIRSVLSCWLHHILLNGSKLHQCGNTATHSLDQQDNGRSTQTLHLTLQTKPWCGGPHEVNGCLKMYFQPNIYFICTKKKKLIAVCFDDLTPDTPQPSLSICWNYEVTYNSRSVLKWTIHRRTSRRSTVKLNRVQGFLSS